MNSLSELPRNRRQAINAKSQANSTSGIASNGNKDLIYDLLESTSSNILLSLHDTADTSFHVA